MEFIITVSDRIEEDGTQKIIDSKELIRCNDCQWWNEDDHDCNIKMGYFKAETDWFCADGRKKHEGITIDPV